ncbi:putative WD repeat-containing protein 24 -like protein isoform X2 [Capsicum annuum]|nr:putative WD repeat-containing protein 24 -like protein isoform X2 [Capsicum annuum]KAF3666208.1 putative WD repeat-containing protein 24 -like protein isoform X2 [Capsicum annuum]
MNEHGKMMNQQQRMSMSQNQMISMSQPQILNPQLQQQQQQVENNKFNFKSMYNSSMAMNKPPLMMQQQPQMMNRNYMMWPQPPLPPPSVDQLKFQNPNHNLKQFVTGKRSKPLGPRNNWKGKKVNKNDKRMVGTSGGGSSSIAGGNVGSQGGYKPPTLNDLQQQNRLKARRFFPKKKFYHNNNNNNMTAPYAPRNTSSYIIRAKKSGGITSLVSPCPVTPAVLPTPMFSPSREVLVDMAKEEWGVDGYGSMNGLIRLRSPGHEAEGHEDEEEEEEGSSESDVEEHVEVERRLDHDLSRFEMIYPNYSGMEYNNVLGNRVDDQDTHIAQLEEENLILKDRLFLMERELGDLRRRLQSLERQGHGYDEMNEEVVENESESETQSHGDGHSLEDNDVEMIERPMEVGNVKGKEEDRIEDDTEFAENKESVGKEGQQVSDNGDDEAAEKGSDKVGGGVEQVDGSCNDEAAEKESDQVGKEDENDDGYGMVEVLQKEIIANVGSKSELNEDAAVKTGNEVQFTQLNKYTENEVQASGSASVVDVPMEEACRVDADTISHTKEEDELPGDK